MVYKQLIQTTEENPDGDYIHLTLQELPYS